LLRIILLFSLTNNWFYIDLCNPVLSRILNSRVRCRLNSIHLLFNCSYYFELQTCLELSSVSMCSFVPSRSINLNCNLELSPFLTWSKLLYHPALIIIYCTVTQLYINPNNKTNNLTLFLYTEIHIQQKRRELCCRAH
jgi:hypothetical protein